jgi:hypothetical protein
MRSAFNPAWLITRLSKKKSVKERVKSADKVSIYIDFCYTKHGEEVLLAFCPLASPKQKRR